MSEILYVHVKRRGRLELGHWFFHTGQWCVCGEAYKRSDDKWYLSGLFQPRFRDAHDEAMTFDNFDEVRCYMERYYNVPVRTVRVRDFPKPEDL